MTSILIVDDELAIRSGLCLLISTEPGLVVVGQAGTASEGVALAESLHPDIVIMDVGLPDMNGICATIQVVKRVPHCAVIILTIHDDDETYLRASEAGARAFVVKGAAADIRRTLLAVASLAV